MLVPTPELDTKIVWTKEKKFNPASYFLLRFPTSTKSKDPMVLRSWSHCLWQRREEKASQWAALWAQTVIPFSSVLTTWRSLREQNWRENYWFTRARAQRHWVLLFVSILKTRAQRQTLHFFPHAKSQISEGRPDFFVQKNWQWLRLTWSRTPEVPWMEHNRGVWCK